MCVSVCCKVNFVSVCFRRFPNRSGSASVAVGISLVICIPVGLRIKKVRAFRSFLRFEPASHASPGHPRRLQTGTGCNVLARCATCPTPAARFRRSCGAQEWRGRAAFCGRVPFRAENGVCRGAFDAVHDVPPGCPSRFPDVVPDEVCVKRAVFASQVKVQGEQCEGRTAVLTILVTPRFAFPVLSCGEENITHIARQPIHHCVQQA